MWPRPAAMLRSMRIVSDGPNVNVSPTMPAQPAQRPAGGGLGERHELFGVARMRHRKVGRQQIVLLAVGNLDPAARCRAGPACSPAGRCRWRWRAARWPDRICRARQSRRARSPGRSSTNVSVPSSAANTALLWKARWMLAALLLFLVLSWTCIMSCASRSNSRRSVSASPWYSSRHVDIVCSPDASAGLSRHEPMCPATRAGRARQSPSARTESCPRSFRPRRPRGLRATGCRAGSARRVMWASMMAGLPSASASASASSNSSSVSTR